MEILRKIVHQPEYDIEAELVEKVEEHGLTISHWRLHLGGHWTAAAVEFIPAGATETCVLVSDWGKQSLSVQVESLLADRKRVLAADLTGFGEAYPGNDPDDNDDVMLMLIATIGERPLGMQVAQITAVARWAAGTTPSNLPSISAIGPRNSVIALLAAAADPSIALESRSI